MTMATTYSISDLARELDITTRAIRFYEEQGMLAPERRGQERVYSAKDKVTLKLILRGKRIGFSLAECRELIELYDPETGSRKQLETFMGKIAERRVRLGLVLAEVGRTNNVQVTEQELAQAMRQEAMRYGPQAQQVFDMFRQNPNAQAQLRAPIFEDKVVDLIVEKATVTDEKVSKDDLLKEDDMPEGYSA